MKMNLKIDKYDKKILNELENNARIAITSLAKKIKLSKETVRYKVQRLKKEHIIKSFNPILNTSILGLHYYKLYIQLNNTKHDIEDEIINFIREKKQCSNLRLLEGMYDISFLIICENHEALNNQILEITIKYGKYFKKKSLHIINESYKFNNTLFSSKRIQQYILNHNTKKKEKVDSIDKEIIKKLLENPRQKITNIANSTNIPVKVISYRIKKLEKNIIVGYTTMFNTDLFKQQLSTCSIALANQQKTNKILEFFMQFGNCITAYKTIGEFDLIIEFFTNDEIQLRELIIKFRDEFVKDYNYYDLHRVFREYDTNWSPLNNSK